MPNATRRAPAGRLGARRLLDSIVTSLQTGTHTNLNADRTTGSLTASTVQRMDPNRAQIRLPDGTVYTLEIR